MQTELPLPSSTGELDLAPATEPMTTCANCNRPVLQRDAKRDNCDDYCSMGCMAEYKRV